MLNQKFQHKLDDIAKDLSIARAISDLLSGITTDPLMDGTIQEIGSFMTQILQACLDTLEQIHSCNIKVEDKTS